MIVAQLAEHPAVTGKVTGSSPVSHPGTFKVWDISGRIEIYGAK